MKLTEYVNNDIHYQTNCIHEILLFYVALQSYETSCKLVMRIVSKAVCKVKLFCTACSCNEIRMNVQ